MNNLGQSIQLPLPTQSGGVRNYVPWTIFVKMASRAMILVDKSFYNPRI